MASHRLQCRGAGEKVSFLCFSKNFTFSEKVMDRIDAIYEVLRSFNFEKVEKTMRALEWKWAVGQELRVPEIDEMKDTCSRLLNAAARDKTTISSGGFEASYKIDDFDKEVFTLKFVVAQDYVRF
jgi:hypothetical protein